MRPQLGSAPSQPRKRSRRRHAPIPGAADCRHSSGIVAHRPTSSLGSSSSTSPNLLMAATALVSPRSAPTCAGSTVPASAPNCRLAFSTLAMGLTKPKRGNTGSGFQQVRWHERKDSGERHDSVSAMHGIRRVSVPGPRRRARLRGSVRRLRKRLLRVERRVRRLIKLVDDGHRVGDTVIRCGGGLLRPTTWAPTSWMARRTLNGGLIRP